MKQTKAKKTSATKLKSFVNVILDKSSSMEIGRDGTISGYNEFVKGLKVDKETDYSISLTQFNIHMAGPELTISYADTPLSEVPALTREAYRPQGGTPLYDAIGECVRRIEAKGRDILVVIITDGEENSSREFDKTKIQALIKEKEALGWKFVFLGAEIDSYQVGGAMGMSVGATANYTKGNEQALYSNLAQSTMLRSSDVRERGAQVANCMAFFSDAQKSALVDHSVDLGGGTAGLGGFPTPVYVGPSPTVTAPIVTATIVTATSKSDAKRRWVVSNAVSNASGGSDNS